MKYKVHKLFLVVLSFLMVFALSGCIVINVEFNSPPYDSDSILYDDSSFSSIDDQLSQADNIFKFAGQGILDTNTGAFSFSSTTGFYCSEVIDTTTITKLVVKIKTSEVSTKSPVYTSMSCAMFYNLTPGNLDFTAFDCMEAFKIDGEFSYYDIDVSNVTLCRIICSVGALDTIEVYAL